MRHDLAIGALLILLTLGVFAPLADADFVRFDDPEYVLENPHVRAGLTLDGLRWAATSFAAGNWHPLTWLSLMLDVELFGVEAGALHATNVLLHLLNTLLVYAFLRFATGSLWRSAFVAALFAVHPLHVESVAWISERKDVLSTSFGLLSLLAWARYARDGRWTDYALSLAAFLLGLGAKPMLVTLPFLLLLLDAWPLGRTSRWPAERADWADGLGASRVATLAGLLLEKLPFLVAVGISSVATVLAQDAAGAVKPLADVDLATRIATAGVAGLAYVTSALWPTGLAIFYPHPLAWPLWRVAIAWGALLGATLLLLRASRRRPCLAVGWLWFLGALVPVIGLIQIGNQWMADRYSYWSYTGLFVLFAWSVPNRVESALARRVIASSAVGCVLAYAFVAHVQVGYWSDTRTLFERALAVTHQNFVAHSVLGTESAREGRLDLAIEHYTRSLALQPDYQAARLNLVQALLLQGRLEETIPHLRHLLSTRPDDPSSYFNLALALEKVGRSGEALPLYERGLALEPDEAEMWRHLERLYRQAGRRDAARRAGHEAQKAERRSRERGGAP